MEEDFEVLLAETGEGLALGPPYAIEYGENGQF
jgi:hypothetical protein